MDKKKPKPKSKPTRTRKSSVLKTKTTTKKKVYFTGSKNGKATYGSKPNKNIVGSVGAPKKKKK